MITNDQLFSTARKEVIKSFGVTPDALIKKWEAVDPAGFALMEGSQLRRLTAAILCENVAVATKDRPHEFVMNQEARELFEQNGMMAWQVGYAKATEAGNSTLAESFLKMREATTTGAVASIAQQIIILVVRAVATNPTLGLVGIRPMMAKTANVSYEDFLYDSDGGAYSNGYRIDTQEDPTYSDRSTCTTSAKEIRVVYQNETMTATDKVLGAQVCITAEQDANAIYGLSPQERLSQKIFYQVMREFGRLVAQDLTALANSTASWSSTATGVFTALNPNEYRKVLGETIVAMDATINGKIYESPTWLMTTPASWSYLEKIKRFDTGVLTRQLQQTGTLKTVSGENGASYDNYVVYKDQFFAANTILMGLTEFTVAEHAGQPAYIFAPYQMADNVKLLFKPLTQVMEMGAIFRAGRKMLEPKAFGVITIS